MTMSKAAQAALDWPRAMDVMKTEVVTVAATMQLADAERLLSEHQISGVPVTDEAGRIVGVLSMKDLLECRSQDVGGWADRSRGFYEMTGEESLSYVGGEEPDWASDTVAEVMTAQVHAVPCETSLPEVARQMIRLGVHRLLVTEQGRYVGLISSFDVLGALGRVSRAAG
ncbi:MAG: CBS domain-containing protein [Planctomycetota bacterium]